MSDGIYKDRQLPVRLPADLNEDVSKLANELHTNPSNLARTLLAQYVRAYREHGGNMPWPPQFQYFDTEPVRDPRQAAGKGESHERRALRVAAEDQVPYGTTRDRAGSGREG